MKSLLCVAVAVCLAAVPSLVRAHGGMEHVMGTVKSIEASSITVESTKKKDIVVVTNDKTRYEQSGKPATAKELTVGERVVVHAKKSEAALLAEIVKWGQPASSPKHTDHHDKDHDHDHPKK